MSYQVEFEPEALADLDRMDSTDRLTHEQLQQVSEFIAFLKFRNRSNLHPVTNGNHRSACWLKEHRPSSTVYNGKTDRKGYSC